MENPRIRSLLVFPVLALLGAAVYLLFFWHRPSGPAQNPVKDHVPESPLEQVVTASSPPAGTLPDSSSTDGCPTRDAFADPASWITAVQSWCRIRVAPLCTGKKLGQLLEDPDFLRKLVALVNNIAQGESFTPHLPLSWKNPTPYQVMSSPHGLVPHAGNSARYVELIREFRSLEIKRLVALLPTLYPALQYLHQELGQSSDPFDRILLRAFDRVQKVHLPNPPPVLEQGVQSFRYQERLLEELPQTEKAFIRLGVTWNELKKSLSEWNLQIRLQMVPTTTEP